MEKVDVMSLSLKVFVPHSSIYRSVVCMIRNSMNIEVRGVCPALQLRYPRGWTIGNHNIEMKEGHITKCFNDEI